MREALESARLDFHNGLDKLDRAIAALQLPEAEIQSEQEWTDPPALKLDPEPTWREARVLSNSIDASRDLWLGDPDGVDGRVMTKHEVQVVISALRRILPPMPGPSEANSTAAPGETVDLVYRPNRHDDWGMIRTKDGELFAVVRCPIGEEEADRHRANKTDPFEPLARRLISAFAAPVDAGVREALEIGKELNEILNRYLASHDGDEPHYADVLREWLWDHKARIAAALSSQPVVRADQKETHRRKPKPQQNI